jgi:hypothetical protein
LERARTVAAARIKFMPRSTERSAAVRRERPTTRRCQSASGPSPRGFSTTSSNRSLLPMATRLLVIQQIDDGLRLLPQHHFADHTHVGAPVTFRINLIARFNEVDQPLL